MLQKRAMNKIFVSILLLIFSLVCKSQTVEEPDFSADRPGMATPPSIVQPEIFQIETGYAFEKITGENIFQETTLFNTSLLRYGINKNSEIRMQTDYAQVKTHQSKITGFDPLIVGTKLLITEGKSVLPQTSFMFNLTLPYIGNKNFRPDNIVPSAYLLFQNDITEKLNVCYNAGLEYDGETTIPSTFTAVCFGYSFSDKFGGFIENYDWFSNAAGPLNYVDLGCTYMAGKNFQIDVSGNMNLRDFKNYFMINFGVSWRIIKREKKKKFGVAF